MNSLLDDIKTFRLSFQPEHIYDAGNWFFRLIYVNNSINILKKAKQFKELFNKCLEIKGINYLEYETYEIINYSCVMEILELMEKFAKNAAFL